MNWMLNEEEAEAYFKWGHQLSVKEKPKASWFIHEAAGRRAIAWGEARKMVGYIDRRGLHSFPITDANRLAFCIDEEWWGKFKGEVASGAFRPPPEERGEMSEMKHWRPEEGWNPSEIRQRVLMLCAEAEPSADCQIRMIEAGADAMLEARKELDERILSTLCTVRLQMREAGWDAKLDSLIEQLLVILGAPYLKGGEVDSVKEANDVSQA